ncbi:General APC amino acid permease [Mycena chlorophos]|uniref:General APC amino acid permease n=1 Tax=Mycena chlorophos TaxID=658473 RepID=A0A8H6RY47_MYCCL|nr:General APC amino acid permease [Mycena chlorophos]
MDYKWRASKSSQEIVETVASDDRYDWDYHDVEMLQRRLKQRHVQMIAVYCWDHWNGQVLRFSIQSFYNNPLIGLFLGSGNALQVAGPLGSLLAYGLVASVAYSSLCSVGEMTTWAPISGTFPHYAARWVDPALGFAVGWNYFYSNATSVPVEINAAVILLTFWDKDANHAAIYTALIVLTVWAINIFGVRYFGESEFFFSSTKLLVIIIILCAGLVLDLGGGPDHERIGFKFWINPGAVNRAGLVQDIGADRFFAILKVVIQAAFSFQGMELVCIAASETENPRRNIAKAVRRVFYRIVVFYMLGILMVGMLVPFNNPALLSDTGTAAQSPFVIALHSARVKGNLPAHRQRRDIHQRHLCLKQPAVLQFPRALRPLDPWPSTEVPLVHDEAWAAYRICVGIGGAFALLSFMNVSEGSETVFNWLVNITTTGGFIGWFSMNLTYSFFRRGMIAQGYDLKKNVYHNALQPYLSYWHLRPRGMGWTIFFIFINGFAVFFKFNTSMFLTAYINIPIFAIMYFGYKIVYRTKIWKPLEMDFVTGIPTVEETELPPDPPVTFLEKVAAAVF